MSVNPNQGQNPDSSGQYGGYTGYTPPQSNSPKDDPYNAQWYGGQQQPGADAQAGAQQQQYSAGPQQQQQQYYQPPLSASARQSGTGGANDMSSFGLNARIVALLSYLFIWVGGIFFLLFERRNRFVRFSAAQSVTIFGPLFILYVLLRLIAVIPFIGFLLGPVIGCLVGLLLIGGGLLWVFLMVQAYRGVAVRLPIVSDYADALLARFSRSRRGTTV
ncbi:MAG TPA: hypothetical protein VL485_11000 [Ktedonobacteraceae bacterium]|nr:hypothetical protein [Ktedonobacteraceae bacterium]